MILLDTNVVSEPIRERPDPRVQEWLDAQVVETLYLSTISLSELLLGVENLLAGRRREDLASAIGEQIGQLFRGRLIPFDVPAAEAYARIVVRLRRQGRPISVGDGQIAAIAAAHGFSIATRDEAPFRIAGLTVINPWTARP